MGRKKAEKKRKNELKIIFFIILVAAALFVVSTYAWFSTQRNVSITNLGGIVEVAEGLEISLDAKTWSNGIVIGDDKAQGQLSITEDAYPDHKNMSPTEMLPVSTLGLITKNKSGSYDMTGLSMLRGKLTNSKELSSIAVIDETNISMKSGVSANFELLYPGYFAFDIFLKNSSKDSTKSDVLQLNYDSSVEIMEADNSVTGLQNTVRVAFAKYGGIATATPGVWSGVADVMDGQTDVLKKTGAYNSSVGGADVYLTDCAIWEPNANDHAEYIVNNNNIITWSSTDSTLYNTYKIEDGKYGFGTTTQMPTYALKNESVGKEISDIYNWNGTNSTTLAKQNVIQTTKTSTTDYTINEGVMNLKSTSDGTTDFTIAPQCIIRLRIYVWLEGQDVDCINYASHGGGVYVNIGLVKGATEGTHGEAE